MGGTTQQKNTTTAQNQSYGQTQQQQQQSQQQQRQSGATSSALTPWAGNSALLNSVFSQLGGIPTGLTPAETNALNQWGALAGAGNPYAGQIGGVANTLLAGGGDRIARRWSTTPIGSIRRRSIPTSARTTSIRTPRRAFPTRSTR